MKIFFLVLVFLLLVGCHGEESPSKSLPTKVNITGSEDDFVIPSALWKEFEDSYPELTEIAAPKEGEKKEEKKEEEKKVEKNSQAKGEEDELLKRRPSLDPLPLSVTLLEKTVNILGGHNFELSLGAGGGNIDLKDYVIEPKNGTFFLKVKYLEEMDKKRTKVYYVSNSQARKDSPFGSGCNKYFEITKYWQEAMSGEGLQLNTVGLRDVSVVAGTFFFVSPFKGKLRLGHLTMIDSRHKDLLCEKESQF